MRAMKSGSRMVIENGSVGSSKSNVIVERAIQSVQGMIRTMCSAVGEKCEVKVKVDVTHSVWTWIAEQAGFLLTRFEVGRDWKSAYEEEETSRRSAWEGDVHVGGWRVVGHQSNHRRSHHVEPEWRSGSQERSGGRQREKGGNEAIWI